MLKTHSPTYTRFVRILWTAASPKWPPRRVRYPRVFNQTAIALTSRGPDLPSPFVARRFCGRLGFDLVDFEPLLRARATTFDLDGPVTERHWRPRSPVWPPSNELVFDARLLDALAPLGDKLTNPTILKMCDKLLEEFELRHGLSGKVRVALLVNLAEPTPVDAIARDLGLAMHVRRKLQEEGASIQKLRDELDSKSRSKPQRH